MSDGMFYVVTNDGKYEPIGKLSGIQISEAERNDGDLIVFDRNMAFEFEMDYDGSALMTVVKTIINLNTNNWRKLHGLRMLHRNRMPERGRG